MTGRRWLLSASIFLSAVHGVVMLLPYVFIWLVLRSLLQSHGAVDGDEVLHNAQWALGLTLISILLYFLALTLSHLAAFRVETNMRRRAMHRLMQMPPGYFNTRQSGNIRKIIDEDSSMTHTFLAHVLPDLAGSIMAPLGILALMLWVDWRLGLITFIPLAIAFGIMIYMMDPRRNKFQRLYLDAQERMASEAVEYVRGIPAVKIFQQTVFSFNRFYDSIMDYRDLCMKHVRGWKLPYSIYFTVMNSVALFLIPGAILLIGFQHLDPATVIADLLLYLLIVGQLASTIMKVMYTGQGLMQVNEALSRLEKLTDAPSLKVLEPTDLPTEYTLELKEVTFTYPEAKEPAVDQVSFVLPAGKSYALVGPSGSGKSTLARLIPRFRDVDKGTVMIGGMDVRHIEKRALMEMISFVFQRGELFAASIRENITYGCHDYTEEDLHKAIEGARCRALIERLPEGLDTVIGTEGTYLSGGEIQRIILARAILKDAPIAIFDEATAFADPENEVEIRKALTHLSHGKTTLMIAHRLSSIQDVDCILVMDKGRIVERGTHDELLAVQGLYARMWSDYRQAISWKIK